VAVVKAAAAGKEAAAAEAAANTRSSQQLSKGTPQHFYVDTKLSLILV